MALGKAALPLRFAEWLQFELHLRFNVETVVEKNTNSSYVGYGLRVIDVTQQTTFVTEFNNSKEFPTDEMIHCIKS